MAASKKRNGSLHGDLYAWQRLLPTWLLGTIVYTAAISAGIAVLIRFGWPYRRELATALVLGVGWSYATDYTGNAWWGLALLVLVLVAVVGPLVAWKRTRRWALGFFPRARTRRLFRAGLKELRTANSAGRLPRIRRVRSTPVGERLSLRCRPGQSAELVDDRVEELRAAVKARDVRVTRDPQHAHRVTVEVVRRDPLASTDIVTWANHDDDTLSMWDQLHWGTDEFGRAVRFPLVYRQLLVGGVMDSGKSSGLNLVVSHAAKCPDAQLLLIDPNRVQFFPWQDRALAFATKSHDDAIDILRLVDAEIDRRQDILDALPGVNRKITRDIANEFNLPIWLLGIDELAYHSSVGGSSAQRTAFNTTARDVVSRCRAFGIVPVAGTQRPTSDVVPTSLRDLFSMRAAYRCTTPTSSDVILGDNWSKRGYSATDIGVEDAGVNWFVVAGRAPIRTKTAWLSDDTIADLAVTTIRNRPGIPAGLGTDIAPDLTAADIPTQRRSDENTQRTPEEN